MVTRFGRGTTIGSEATAAAEGEVLVLTIPSRARAHSGHRVEGTSPQAAVKRTANRYERFGKRVFDLVGSTVLLVVLSPLFLIIAISIRATMGPGVIFRQTRVGKGGRLFTVYKFRSMVPDRRVNADDQFVGTDRRKAHKTPNHPLVTPVGGVLRKLSLDELPQLWNVLRGDMSLVGPRPELPWIVARYEDWQHLRHQVKPGLTGLWQVTTRGSGPMHDRTDVDVEYLSMVRFRSDLWLIVCTVPVVLRRKGSF